MTDPEIESLILRVICGRNRNSARSLRHGGQYGLHDAVRNEACAEDRLNDQQIIRGVWSLIGQGLAYLDYTPRSFEFWDLIPTARGVAAVGDLDINPDDPEYVESLCRRIPSLSDTVKVYVGEASSAYKVGLYRASAVMLGVASEAVTLEVAGVLGQRIQRDQAKRYLRIVHDPKKSYHAKLEEFWKKLKSNKDSFPVDLPDGLDSTITAVCDLLRVYRNDAGHPTGKVVDRNLCQRHLGIFVPYAEKLYELKACLETLPASSSGA